MAGGRSGGGDSGDVVTLACVLEGRASPLTEEETWAFLAATATTVQDALLSGTGGGERDIRESGGNGGE